MIPSMYSVRMRSRRHSQHHSGAERLVPSDEVEQVAAAMIRRALHHSRGQAETIELVIDELDSEQIEYAVLPDVQTWQVSDFQQGRRAAAELLCSLGVSPTAVETAFADIIRGAAPNGGNMRGAMLVDADSGGRLEPDPARGVRVSRMDLSAEARRELSRVLQQQNLDREPVREALVLAAKVRMASGIVAELCWSDDPDYTAGYVASPQRGYVRFPTLKPLGDQRGGRAFFVRVDPRSLSVLMDFLQQRPVLFDRIGHLLPPRVWRENSS